MIALGYFLSGFGFALTGIALTIPALAATVVVWTLGEMIASPTVRRMVSGFVIRDGNNGTQNLTAVGRTNLPAWAVRAYNVSAAQSGPGVSTTYPLGRYIRL